MISTAQINLTDVPAIVGADAQFPIGGPLPFLNVSCSINGTPLKLLNRPDIQLLPEVFGAWKLIFINVSLDDNGSVVQCSGVLSLTHEVLDSNVALLLVRGWLQICDTVFRLTRFTV